MSKNILNKIKQHNDYYKNYTKKSLILELYSIIEINQRLQRESQNRLKRLIKLEASLVR